MSRGVGLRRAPLDDPLAAADAPRRHSPSAAPFRRAGKSSRLVPSLRSPPGRVASRNALGSGDPHRLWCPGLQTRATVSAAAPRRHWPSAAHSAGRESRLRSWPRCARCRGEGCAWATDVGRTDAPVVVRTTRITETGLAARNRLADFPAPPRWTSAAAPQRAPRSEGRGRPAPARRTRQRGSSFDSPLLVIARF